MLRMILWLGGAALAFALSTTALAQSEPFSPPGDSPPELTLARALALALKNNPELAAYNLEIRAREAEELQAGLRPNPALSAELENVAGSGELSGIDAAETTLVLSQVVELGAKRLHRRSLAEAETELARSDYEIARVDVLARTTRQFIAVLAAQERLRLTGDLVALAQEALETVRERIEGGKAAATEAVRANILLAELRVAQGTVRHALNADLRRLAALLGEEEAGFAEVTGDLSRLPHLPALAELEDRISRSPVLERWMVEMERRRKAVELERSQRIPDVELALGARHENEVDDIGFLLGFSVPLQIFDRNQGDLAAARSRLEKARAQARSARLAARASLAAAWQQMGAAHDEAEALRDAILPAAKQAFQAAEYGYRAGKFSLLDVLDAQRTLVQAQESYLRALASFHQAVADIEGLLGSALPGLAIDSETDKENNPS